MPNFWWHYKPYVLTLEFRKNSVLSNILCQTKQRFLMNAEVTHIPRILQWNISSSWYCTLIVSFTNFNCNSRVINCKDSFKGTNCNRMFCDLRISNSFASFINHQGQNIQLSKLSDLEKRSVFWLNKNFLHYCRSTEFKEWC